MPRIKKDYECYRCGYTTTKKTDMNKHLFKLTKPCPPVLHKVTLTDDIKNTILEERTYEPAVIEETTIPVPNQPQGQTGNIVLNNYGVLSNQVLQMETTDKITSALRYNGVDHVDYENVLEGCFQPNLKRLEDRSFRTAYVMDKMHLLDCFNKATSSNGDVSKLSVFYEKRSDKIKIYRDGQWEQYLPDLGLLVLIRLMKSYLFNDYELYLIRNLHDPVSQVRERFLLKEHLEIYYQFLGCFDEKPEINNVNDIDVLNFQPKENRNDWLSETYSKLYKECYDKLKATEKNNLRTKLMKIVISNTNQNVLDLNNAIMDILKIDPEYRQQITKILL